jgi:putative iron-regulated protein
VKKFNKSKILTTEKNNFQWRSYFWAVLLLSVTTLGIACSNNTTTKNSEAANQAQTKGSEVANKVQTKVSETIVLSDFTNNVVIPTYQQLVTKSNKLQQATTVFVQNPNDNNLKAVQSAWKDTRVPWEQSEAFAFGPAESSGYDGNLDDWPVNHTDLSALIKSNEKLNPDYVKTKLQTTQKGFHAIEYLLFGENSDRQASQLSERELELLQLLTTDFNKTAKELQQSWVARVNGKPAFREVFTTAGKNTNTTYPTTKAALAEIVNGIIGCVEEVGEEKIGKPIASKQNFDLESRFSHSSLNDFKNNLTSARNAYLGEFNGTKGQSVSDLVAQADPAVDQEIKTQLQTALDALEAVPTPVETKLNDATALEKLKTAQGKILTTYRTIQTKALPLFEES